MTRFKTIEKLGLSITEWGYGDKTSVVLAHELESLLQSAQVVYGVWDKNGCRFAESQFPGHTHTAMLLNITPIKKKTKAEAALEFVKSVSLADSSCSGAYVDEAKRILEMKDEV